MIGLDTNLLARYYIYDATHVEALHQRPFAQKLINSAQPLAVCKTVIIELEWLIRRHYQMKRAAGPEQKLLGIVEQEFGSGVELADGDFAPTSAPGS